MRIRTSFLFYLGVIISGCVFAATMGDQSETAGSESAGTASGTEPEDMAKRMRAGVQSVTPMDVFERSTGTINYSTCLPCHGGQAQGDRAVYAPPLAGQKRWYLDRQLEHFRLGIRGWHENDVHNAVMHPIARALEISGSQEAVLDEIADFPVTAPASEVPGGRIEAGKEIYEQLCSRCHGENGEGNREEGAPRLNILPDWYIIRQLENFQAGFRGEHEADEYGQLMRPLSLTVMEPNEMLDLTAYIETLKVDEQLESESDQDHKIHQHTHEGPAVEGRIP